MTFDLFTPEIAYGPDLWLPQHMEPTVRHPDHSKEMMRRPFIMWDGEGYTDENGQHHYWTISNSTGAGIVAPEGRSLHRSNIARLFMETYVQYPKAIHVGFALGYDFTCILRGNGLGPREWQSITKDQILVADGFVYKSMMGKMLSVWYDSAENTGSRFTLNDTWGFFQRSFVKALDEYFGPTWESRDLVIEMKNARAGFDSRDNDKAVLEYNAIELKLGVELMEELRDRLFQSGMPINGWYGPGALANGLMGKWKIKNTLIDLYSTLPAVATASQYAYAGGRFELFKPGHVGGRTYQYDINSAYPHAIAQLPNLKAGKWVHRINPDLESLSRFSVCLIEWDSKIGSGEIDAPSFPTAITDVYPESVPFPFWRRGRSGNISYPSYGVYGWYWYPEIVSGLNYSDSLGESYGFTWSISEAWEFIEDDPSVRPFGEVPKLYDLRQKLKANGNGAHIGIKLGLNSLYGKLAQQIGWTPEKPNIPAYHNMALAGWVTALCRSMLLDAMALNPTAIIAVETDGIFSTAPLDLPVGIGLGEWDATEYDDMYYFASGVRFGIIGSEVYKPATRGIPARDISLDTILRKIKDSLSILEVEQTQFITIGWANSTNRRHEVGNWRKFEKHLLFMCEDTVGKRIHDPDCWSCYHERSGIRKYFWDQPHLTQPNAQGAYKLSEKHKIAWVDGTDTENQKEDAEMDALFD
jgi:hypothetical protein